MPDPLPPHSHCLICDEPIPETESYCSEACKAEYDRKIKKSKRTMLYFYVGAFVLMTVVAVVFLFIG